MKAMKIWVGLLMVPSVLTVAGCPAPGPGAAAVLEGEWTSTIEGGGTATFTFNANGVLVRIVGENEEGATATFTVTGATSTVNGSDVTITVPLAARTVTYNATLSEDENTLTGTLTAEIEFGEDLVITLPQGDLVLERVPDGGAAG